MVDATSLVPTGEVTAKMLPYSKARPDALVKVRTFMVVLGSARKSILAYSGGIGEPRLTLSDRCIFVKIDALG